MTTKVYRWDDASAPQLKATSDMSDMQGQFLAILDACLVNGYGDKTSLGWNLSYSATNKRVYQIPAGMFLRVEEGVTFWSARGVKVCGYEQMIDIDNGIGKFPTSAIINNQNNINIAGENFAWMYAVNDSQITSTRRWVICGDEKAFWVWIDMVSISSYWSSNFKPMYFFGEYVSDFTNDEYATLLSSIDISNGDYACQFTKIHQIGTTSYHAPDNGHATTVSARKYDGIGNAAYTPLVSAGISGYNPSVYSIGCYPLRYPLPPAAAKVYLQNITVMDAQAGFSNPDSINIIRGFIPGVKLLLQANVGNNFDTFQDDSGNYYLILPVGSYYEPSKQLALQTSNWR